MRNVPSLLIIAALMAGTVLAQQSSESSGDVMAELMNYSDEPAAKPAALAEIKPAPTVQPVEIPVAQPVTIPDATFVAAVTTEPDVDSMVEDSLELYQGGNFTEALQGFAEIIEIAPENIAARMYLRTLLERDHKTVEIEGMKAVDAAWSTDLVLRSYTLASGARAQMELEDVTSPVDVGVLFPQIKFPEEASAIYQPETETIFVKNTAENLAVLETMLDTMEVLKGSGDAEQVEIEAKFVEIAEGTLEELGFQWDFANSIHAGIGGADLDVNDGAGLFSDALRGSPTPGAPGLPFDRQIDLGDGTLSASGDWSSFRVEDTFNTLPSDLKVAYTGGNAFDVLISALDQSTGADVLSAPRIVTRNGEEATIRVGEIHYFPEVFEGDSAQAVMLNVSYQDFEEKLLGVELTVIPKISEEREITLQLNPRITELAGWQSYQLAAPDSIYNYRQQSANKRFNHPAIIASLPIFKKREIETEVTIADGSTIGMGGLISEKIEAFEDNVPVLGSLPLVGRLFRNEGERAVKRNLLMFVTARIVDPNGRINTSRSFE